MHAARLFILGMFPYVAAGLLTMTFGHPRGCVLLAGITAATMLVRWRLARAFGRGLRTLRRWLRVAN